jgi:hypothetical protein
MRGRELAVKRVHPAGAVQILHQRGAAAADASTASVVGTFGASSRSTNSMPGGRIPADVANVSGEAARQQHLGAGDRLGIAVLALRSAAASELTL